MTERIIRNTEKESINNDSEQEIVTPNINSKEEQSDDIVNRIRSILDLNEVALSNDPEGIAKIHKEFAQMEIQITHEQKEVTTLNKQLSELRQKQSELWNDENNLQETLYNRQQKSIVKLKKLFRISDKNVTNIKSQIEGLPRHQEEIRDEISRIDNNIWAKTKSVKDLATKKTDIYPNYFEQFETPLSIEGKKELLKFDALSKLSTEEYISLWRRLNPQFMTHITRQGVRDHNSMVYHSAGLGEFHSGFTKMLEDDLQLRTPMEVRDGLYNVNKQSASALLEKIVYPEANSSEEALTKLNAHYSSAAFLPAWPDRRAVHMAQLTVLDEYYGGETGNEIFIVYPTDVLASQCRIAHASSFTEAETIQERRHNDAMIFPDPEKPSLPLDAGLIFIPKNQMVDLKTGSKYASREVVLDGKKATEVLEDEELIAKFEAYMRSLTVDSLEIQNINIMNQKLLELGFKDENVTRIIDLMRANDCAELNFFLKNRYFEMTKDGIPDTTFDSVGQPVITESFLSQSPKYFLKLAHAGYKTPDNLVSSQEYWENYFAAHPEQQPKHVIFYEEADPSRAIINFIEDNNIGKQVSSYQVGYSGNQKTSLLSRDDIKNDCNNPQQGDSYLGFSDSVIEIGSEDSRNEDSFAWQGYDKLMEIAKELIDKHYNNK